MTFSTLFTSYFAALTDLTASRPRASSFDTRSHLGGDSISCPWCNLSIEGLARAFQSFRDKSEDGTQIAIICSECRHGINIRRESFPCPLRRAQDLPLYTAERTASCFMHDQTIASGFYPMLSDDFLEVLKGSLLGNLILRYASYFSKREFAFSLDLVHEETSSPPTLVYMTVSSHAERFKRSEYATIRAFFDVGESGAPSAEVLRDFELGVVAYRNARAECDYYGFGSDDSYQYVDILKLANEASDESDDAPWSNSRLDPFLGGAIAAQIAHEHCRMLSSFDLYHQAKARRYHSRAEEQWFEFWVSAEVVRSSEREMMGWLDVTRRAEEEDAEEEDAEDAEDAAEAGEGQ